MLGVTDANKLQLLRSAASKRPVRIAVVGLGGVSRAKMAALTDGNTLEYCNGVTDPGNATRDVHPLRIMSELTAKLGIRRLDAPGLINLWHVFNSFRKQK